MPSYKRADVDVLDCFARMFERKGEDEAHVYADHGAAETRFVALLAFPTTDDDGEVKTPAISIQGTPHYLKVTILPARYRFAFKADVLIEIDGEAWEGWTDAERDAVMDEAIYSVVVARDAEGHFRGDEQGQPRLKIRRQDLVMRGYRRIAEIHGEASQEARALETLAQIQGQLVMGWAEPQAPRRKKEKARA